MTENTLPAQSPEPEPERDAPDAEGKSNAKTIWAGVGIGSAALVAALMYASKRPKRRGK
jgi:hypothetical protein